MNYRQAERKESAKIAYLAKLLWDSHTEADLIKEIDGILKSGTAAVYIAAEQAEFVGFAMCQLRHDYVEGTESSPVGYLEGIYVKEPYRGKGIAKTLLQKCEQWAKQKGCKEFASDCTLENDGSFQFHIHSGFQEANRIICFTKRL